MKPAGVSHDEFERLAMPLLDPLYNFARWLTHDQTEAEDLVQETFAKALRGFGTFIPGTDFRAWMFRILRNTFLTSRTGLQAKLTVSFDEEDSVSAAVTWDTPETYALASANRETLQAAIDDLPVPYREVVLLCDVEEMTYQEISDVLSVPIGTVMSRLSRARRQLRQALSSERALFVARRTMEKPK